MVKKWPFLKHLSLIFFFQNWKRNLSRTFVIYVIDFDLIGISTCLTLLNDHQNLNFVKYIYVAGKKRPEIVVNWPYAKVVCFFGIQSLGLASKVLSVRHTAYSWNILCQKWEGDCGLWVPNEIIKKHILNILKIEVEFLRLRPPTFAIIPETLAPHLEMVR